MRPPVIVRAIMPWENERRLDEKESSRFQDTPYLVNEGSGIRGEFHHALKHDARYNTRGEWQRVAAGNHVDGWEGFNIDIQNVAREPAASGAHVHNQVMSGKILQEPVQRAMKILLAGLLSIVNKCSR